MSSILKSSRFLPLFVTQFFGAFNDNVFKNALLIWFTYYVAENTGMDSKLIVSVAAGLFILPFFLFSALAGQIADKYEKSQLIVKIKIIEIILMIICAIGFYLENVFLLLGLLFLMGVQSSFFGPLKYSMLPLHLKDDELITGNALIEAGTFLSILLGTIIGGIIILTETGKATISVIVLICALMGWIASLKIPAASISDKNLKINFNIFTETWNILKYARIERTVWLSIIGISWFWLVGATFLTQFPIYTKNIIGGNEHVVTLFLSLFSVGIGVGSIICNKLLKGNINGRLVPYGCMGMTISIVIFYLAGNLYYNSVLLNGIIGLKEFLVISPYSTLIVASLLSLSICSGIYIVPLYAIMQHRSEEKYLSRIIASNNILNALFMVVASIIAVFLFSRGMNVNQILLTIGLVNIIIFFIIRNIVRKRLGNA